MATAYKFSSLPNINIPRTLMDVKCTHPTSFNHGKVIPLFCIPVGPGENYKLYLNSFLRMQNPIFPFYGNVKCFVHSFHVPMRLLWNHTPEFFGENVLSKGPQPLVYTIPQGNYGEEVSGAVDGDKVEETVEGVTTTKYYNFPVVHSVSHYLGKPLRNIDLPAEDYFEEAEDYQLIKLSVLKERGYWAIYNEYYRPQQLIDPVYIDTGDTGAIGSDPNRKVGGVATKLTFATEVATCSKMYDYFRSGTIAPIYSDEPVSVPLGEYAPLAFKYSNDLPDPYVMSGLQNGEAITALDKSIYFGRNIGALGSDGVYYGYHQQDGSLRIRNPAVDGVMNAPLAATDGDFKTNIVADLRSIAGINVDEIRRLFAVYNYLYRDNFGTRLPEIIQTHFNVKPSIAILQRPEILHEGSFDINVSQVLSTAGATDDSSTKLGQPGANSVTANRQLVVDRSFDEWGFVYIMIETKHERVYSAGVDAYDIRKNKFDFYFPEFATIGNKKIQIQEVSVDTPQSFDKRADAAWAYQESWAEERYMRNRVSGRLDPRAPSSYSYMTLADATPDDAGLGLSKEWILEDRDAIARCLVTGEAGDDYTGDFAITGVMAKPMPLYSEPGLIDHIGMW